MQSVIMGSLEGSLERIAFDTGEVKHIISKYKANTVYSESDGGLFVEFRDEVYPVKEFENREEIRTFFILLESGIAYNVNDYQILFNLKDLPDHFLSGTDATGRRFLCRKYENGKEAKGAGAGTRMEELDAKVDSGNISQGELKELKTMITNMKEGNFFEALTMEFSGKIKEVAEEFIEFRKDIQKRIEPDMVEIASRDIPEASYQLEGINDTLEKSTMKIMDINEEQMDIANRQLERLKSIISGNAHGNDHGALWDNGLRMIQEMKGLFANIPEEARQICQFFVPSIDGAMDLFTRKGEPKEIMALLDEPLSTINDLIADFGRDNEALTRLDHLSSGLVEILKGAQEGGNGGNGKRPDDLTLDQAVDVIKEQMDRLKKMGDLSLSMMEPLSFQDLVGQRIQRIIRLVKSMELR
ncbi:MAG: hypothetical protein ABII06_16375, partial [Pseudomonadota bacterium]